MTATRATEGVRAAARAPQLRLAPREPCHAAPLFELLNDWEVVRMLAVVPWPLAEADVRSAMAGEAPGIDGFVVLAGSVPVGAASVKRPGSGDPPRRMPRLGYWIGRRHWGQGYGTAVVGLLADRAFATSLDAEVIGAGVFADNPASRRVLEKHGFRRAGGYLTPCRARGAPVLTDDMQLSRAAWESAARERAAR